MEIVFPPHHRNIPAHRPLPAQTHATIGDRLSEKGISWAWYAGGWADAVSGHADSTFQYHHQPFAYFAAYAAIPPEGPRISKTRMSSCPPSMPERGKYRRAVKPARAPRGQPIRTMEDGLKQRGLSCRAVASRCPGEERRRVICVIKGAGPSGLCWHTLDVRERGRGRVPDPRSQRPVARAAVLVRPRTYAVQLTRLLSVQNGGQQAGTVPPHDLVS
jgi:Phosphoesterase family